MKKLVYTFLIVHFLINSALAQDVDRLQLGLTQLESGELQNAAQTFQSIVDVDKKNAQAWCGLGRALDGLEPGSADAERALNRALWYDRRYGEAYYYLAVMWTHRPNRHRESMEQLKLAVHFSPHFIDAWLLLGYLHEENANEKPAVLMYSDALLKNPHEKSLYDNFLRTAFDYQYENLAIKTLSKFAEVSDDPGRVTVDLAETYRRSGDVKRAAELFEEIESAGLKVPQSHANLIKARVFFDQQRDDQGSDSYWAGVNAISDSADRKAFYDDVCFILQNDEYDQHVSAPIDSLPRFYQRLWRSRDPNLATILNERLAEHYRRLSWAEQSWRRSPVGYKHSITIHKRTTEGGQPLSAVKEVDDALGHGLATFREDNLIGDEFIQAAFFPKALPRDRTLDDMAVVYIRHGKPTREVMPNFSGGGNNKTWVYEKNQKQPRMIFHFQRIGEHTGWVLEAVPGNTENLEQLHGRYAELQDLETDELRLSSQARAWANDIVRENITFLEQAMTSETSDYEIPERPIDVPYQYLAFKGENKSEVELFYLIHGSTIDLDSTEHKVDVDEFMCIHNDKWDEVARHNRRVQQTVNLSPQQWSGSGFVIRESFPLASGNYFTEFQAVDNIGIKRAIHKDSLYVPDYHSDLLMLSDVILSSEIDEAQSSPFERKGVPLNPHMFYAFDPNGFVGVYFEIYNLQSDASGKTNYEVSFTVQSTDVKTQSRNNTIVGFVKNIFMDKRQVTTRFESEGRTADDYLYMNLQFPDRAAGRYELIIRVKDMLSGQITSTQTQIALL